MFGLAKVFGSDPRTSRRQARRRRLFRASIEVVEDRQLMSTLSAINWINGGQEQHTAVFAIAADDNVYVDEDAKGWLNLGAPPTKLGDYALQISAGLDLNGTGLPKVYAIAADHSVWSNDFNGTTWSSVWTELSSDYAEQVSATADNVVFFIGSGNTVHEYSGNQQLDNTLVGRYALQISAGMDASGRPDVYAIGQYNGLYVNDGAGWQQLPGQAKQISATSDDIVYAIGMDGAVYAYRGSNFVKLGGYALEISGGFDAYDRPEVFAIGSDNALYVNDGGWQGPLGVDVREIAAPSVDIGLPGNVAYAIGSDHQGYLYRYGYSRSPLYGYLQLPENPGTMSAINWMSGGQEHTAVFAIGAYDNVYFDEDATGWVSLGGPLGRYVVQISAGLDAYSQPEVYAVGADHGLYVNHLNGSGWFSLGGYVKQISATATNTVYVIGSDNAVYANRGSGYVGLGGYALQISAGMDAYGRPEVYAIGTDYQLYVNDYGGWRGLGGYVKQITATADNIVYAIGSDDAVYANRGSGYVWLGGYALGISGGFDAYDRPEVFAIGSDNAVSTYTLTAYGWSFARLGGYFREIAAPSVDIGLPGGVAYAIGSDHAGYLYRYGYGFSSLGGYLQG